MTKKLTHEFISQRTKCDRLDTIKNLNLWGNDLEDITILKNMPNLEVVSLSVNKIRTLKDFSYLKKLKELYLRKNNISDINEIKYLTHLPNLRILWLSENPIADVKNYREIVIKSISLLTKLDDNVISIDEREKIENTKFDEENNDNNNSFTEDSSNKSKEEENVFESHNFNNCNNDLSNNKNEIYSNNAKNKKIIDKFNYGHQSSNSNTNLPKVSDKISNVSSQYRGKSSYVVCEDNNVLQEFENLNLKEIENKNMKRYNSLYNKNENLITGNNENTKNTIISKNKIDNDSNGASVKESSRTSNIMNCVIMLLKELNESELEQVQSEIDKKLSKF